MNDKITGLFGSVLTAVASQTTTNETLETISLILTIIGGLLTFIIMPLISWFKKSMADGKLTKDEVVEGVETLSDGTIKVIESTKDKEEK